MTLMTQKGLTQRGIHGTEGRVSQEMHSCSWVKQSCLCFPVEKKWWNTKNQLSPWTSRAKSPVSSCVCSVGRGFQAGDSPVCYMLICCKNLKSLGGSSSVLLDCPGPVSEEADAQRPLDPEYSGFLSSSRLFPLHYFKSPHQPKQNLQTPPPAMQARTPAAAFALESPVPPLPPDLQRLLSVWEQRKSQLLTREMPGIEDTVGNLLLSFFLSVLVAVYF